MDSVKDASTEENRLKPWQAGWLAALTTVAIMISSGVIETRSLIVVWPVMAVISLVLYILYGLWSDSGNIFVVMMLILIPPYGVGEAIYDLFNDRQAEAKAPTSKNI